jgi:hypothetical protein
MDQVVKRILITFLAFVVVSWNIPAFGAQYVHGYTRSNGTYVRPYYRSSPNGTVGDNFSYRGNINPYTGAVGTNRYIHDKTSPYYQGPDSHGRIGHSGASFQPQGYGGSNSVSLNQPQDYGGSNPVRSNQPQHYRASNSVSLCPPPFRMTERDGCQAAR